MIGTRIDKPVVTQAQLSAYSEMAAWCNENHAMIVDNGEYYEVVEVPAPTPEEIAEREAEQANSTEARLADIESALIELAEIIAG